MNITSKLKAENKLTEQQYRSIKDRLSYSSIKLFDNNRKDFYEQMVLGYQKKEKESIAVTMGSLVHLLLSCPEAFDEKYVIASYVKPSGQIGELCDELMIRSMKSMVKRENGDLDQQDKFDVIFQDAVNVVKYEFDGVTEKAFKKKTMETVLGLFITRYNKEGKVVLENEEGYDDAVSAEMYYHDCVKSIGRTVVSMATIESAEKIVDKIRVHPYTADIANLQSSEEVECFNELPILFLLDGVEYKGMVDKLVVDHNRKVIDMYDWKTSWNLDQPQFTFLKYGYYIQAAMYRDAVTMWCKEHELTGYRINPMVFVFCDTTGFQVPIKLVLTDDDVDRACRGFMYRGVRYKGLRELQQEIAWCLESGDWGNSKDLQESKGFVKLGLRYGSL